MSSDKRYMSKEEIYKCIGEIVPEEVKGQWNLRNIYWRKILYRKLFPVLYIDGLPKSVSSNAFFSHLYMYGWAVICYIPEYGIVTCDGAFDGIDFYYMPKWFTPVFPDSEGTTKLTFGENAVFCRLNSPMYGYNGMGELYGVNDILIHYSEILASIDTSISVNLMNSRVAHVFYADDSAQEKTMKKMYDDITAGKPAVFLRDSKKDPLSKDKGGQPYYNNVKQTYIVDLLQDAKVNVIHEYLTLIGIDNNPTEKRERVQSSEVYSNNVEIENSIEDWYLNLKDFCEECNKVLGMNITAKYRYRGIGNEIYTGEYGRTPSRNPEL